MAENLSLNPTAANNVTDFRGGPWARLTGVSVGDTGRTTCGRVTVGSGSFPNVGSAGTITASNATHAGRTFSYVAWVRCDVARSYTHFLSRYDSNTYRGAASSGVNASLAANTWTKIRGTGTVPSDGAVYDRLGVHSDLPTGAAGTIDVGGVRIAEGNIPDLEFADGDTAGWTWNGTAGNSTSQTTSTATLIVRNARSTTRATRPLLTVPAGDPTNTPVFTGRSSSSRWKFILGPATGGWLWEVADAKARRATFRRRAPSSATFGTRGDNAVAERIVELATDLHLLRENSAGTVQQLYRGRVGGVSDELGETGHTVSVPSLDYRGVLERRALMSGSQQTWTQIDQYTIAYGLITQAQNKLGGDYGIGNTAGTSGVLRDREYDLGDSIGQRLQELSEVEDGFDWDIVPQGPSGLNFQTWRPERGEARGVVLEYGGLIKSVTRSVDSKDYANAVRVTGQPPEGSSTPPPPHEGIAAGIDDRLLFPQGRWDKVFGTSIVLTSTLAERRTWLLDHHQVIRPAYTVRLKRGAWDGPDHIWLGDVVRLVIVSGRLRIDTTIRVEEIDVVITESGAEDVTLTLGAPRPDFARRAMANEKRIEELERR